MKISSEIAAGRILLKVSGRFDMDTHHVFSGTYRKVFADNPQKQLVVDLADVDYVDSSALGMLLLLRQDAETHGVVVSLARCTPFVADILRTAHFDRLFDMSA